MNRPALATAITRSLQSRVRPADRVLVACSGGVDSMVLLDVLGRMPPPELARLDVIVAHYNHHVQPANADMEAMVRRRCEELDLLCYTAGEPVEVGPGESFEHKARQARYAFFARLAQTADVRWVLTAHTRDDNEETILMMILDGTGLSGLRGIPLCRPLEADSGVQVLRPMLDVSRADVTGWANRHGVPYVEDPTNTDTRFLRNRVRHELLPCLEQKGNAQIRKHLRALAAEAQAWLAGNDEQLATILDRVWQREASPPTLDTGPLVTETPAFVSAVMLAVLKDLGIQPRAISRNLVEETVALALGTPDVSIDLPECWRARKETDGRVRFIQAARRETTVRLADIGHDDTAVLPRLVEVTTPGETPFTAFGRRFVLLAEECQLNESQLAEHRIYHPPGEELVQPAFAFARPWRIRPRRMGDRYRPLGMTGRKRLKTMLHDHRVRREMRRQWPVLVDATDRIIWVLGMQISEDARVRDFEAPAWRLSIMETGDGPFPYPLRH